MGLIGWVLLGGKFRCRGCGGVIASGRDPQSRLKEGRKPSLGDRGPPPSHKHLGAAGWLATALPISESRGRTVQPTGRRRGGRRGRGLDEARWHRPNLTWVYLDQICPRSFLGQRPEMILRFWARVLFVCFLVLVVVVSTLR